MHKVVEPNSSARQEVSSPILIIGAGFGGLAVARALHGLDAEVLLVDQRNHHLFQPMMYQVAMAQLDPSDIAAPLREIFAGDSRIRPVMDEVTAVDLDDRQVRVSSGHNIDYGALVLATGARYQYLGHPEWQEHVLSLKSLHDAMRLRERVFTALEQADRNTDARQRQAQLVFVIVGAGSTGVELAGALARLLPGIIDKRFPKLSTGELCISLVDPAPHALSSMDEELSCYADQSLAQLGVKLMLGTAVKAIGEGYVRLDSGNTIHAATVIWAAGVEGHGAGDWLAKDLVDDSNRIMVKADLGIPGYSDAWAIGDAAAACDARGNQYPGLAAVAKQQGTHVASLIQARLAGQELGAHARFEYTDYGSMAMISNGRAVAEIRGRKLKGFRAWLLWGVVHLYFLIGMRNRVLVLASWFWAMLTGRRQRVSLDGLSSSSRQ